MAGVSEVETKINLEIDGIENSIILFAANLTDYTNPALSHMQRARENMMVGQPTNLAILKFSATPRWNTLQTRSTADIDLNHWILPFIHETNIDEKISIDEKEFDFTEESNTQQIEHQILVDQLVSYTTV
ncbi:unnamed protein product [Rotaria socialis]|uniref:Uncharacterized protein n=1 Tax=Rotaria socialis TaxID=392032 RepID=A0A820UQ92_9BILA|nr:unnamed protein product [Rotaria socialis]CAF4488735.1 unnamed protein product [Rotaria socialis]CAF4785839.1 unnamed protein product [Rotaria socialis]